MTKKYRLMAKADRRYSRWSDKRTKRNWRRYLRDKCKLDEHRGIR